MEIKEQWQQAPLWQKILIVLILSFLLSYIFFILLIQPKKEEEERLIHEVQDLKNRLETLRASTDERIKQRLILKIKEIKEQNRKNEQKLESFKSIIPSSPQLDEILNYLSAQAKNSKFTVKSFKVEKEEDIELYFDEKENTIKKFDGEKDSQPPENLVKLKQLNITTSLTGDIKGIFPLLDSIVNYKRIINIDSIAIKKDNKLLEYTLKLNIYYSEE